MKALLALALLPAALLAGCAGTPAGGVTPEQDGQGRYVIHMTAGNMMSPASAKVPVGATVVWVLDGGVHDVAADDGSFSSDAELGCKPGQSGCPTEYVHTFHAAGTFPYTCTLHASTGMKGTVTVGA